MALQWKINVVDIRIEEPPYINQGALLVLSEQLCLHLMK